MLLAGGQGPMVTDAPTPTAEVIEAVTESPIDISDMVATPAATSSWFATNWWWLLLILIVLGVIFFVLRRNKK